MAQYLKSLVTGVVLPYVEASLKSADVRKMSASECEAYEKEMNLAPKKAKPKPVTKVKATKPVVADVEVKDFDPEEEVQGVLGALETG